MKCGRILALVACYVSFTGCGSGVGHCDQSPTTLPLAGQSVGGFRSQSWRPRGGPAVAGGYATTGHCCGLRGGGGPAKQRGTDSDAGHACGTGVSVGEKNLLGEQWYGLDELGGPKPLGGSQNQRGERSGGGTRRNHKRKKAEAQQRPRPNGRFGVRSRTRRDEAEMAEGLQRRNRRIPFGRGGADVGASVSLKEEGGQWFSPIRRLLGVCAIWEEGDEGSQIPKLPVGSFNWWVYGKGVARAKRLWHVVAFFQGLQGGLGHVGLGGLHDPQQVREPHGKTSEDLCRGLAPFGNCGRESKRRTSGSDQVKSGYRSEGRENGPTRLERSEAVESSVPTGVGGREVLERAGPHTSIGLVSNRGKRISPHTGGEVHAGHTLGRQGSEWTHRFREVGGGQSEEEIEQRKKGSPQEEVQIRKRGARKMEKQRWRKRKRQRRWEERKRKERRKVLFLELWFGCLQRPGSRRKVQRAGDPNSQLFEMWFTRTPSFGVYWEQLSFGFKVLAGWFWSKSQSTKPAWDEPMEGKKKKKKKGKGAGGWKDGPGLKNKERDRMPSEDEGDGRERKKRDREDKDEEGNNSQEDYAEEAKTSEEYLKRRCFLFIHHFAGRDDVLGKAVKEAAAQRNLKVTVLSVDIENGTGDLSQDEPYLGHLKMAQAGLVDGYHAGFPCTTFSRLKFREAKGYPGPLRTATYPYMGYLGTRQCSRNSATEARS